MVFVLDGARNKRLKRPSVSPPPTRLLVEEEKYNGYYAIVTNELDKPDEEIVEIYRGLWRIEDTFRITKSDLDTRPVYISRRDHIEAHFLTCFVALVLVRLLEKMLDGKYPVSRILESVRRSSCSLLEENIYLFDYYDQILADMRTACCLRQIP